MYLSAFFSDSRSRFYTQDNISLENNSGDVFRCPSGVAVALLQYENTQNVLFKSKSADNALKDQGTGVLELHFWDFS